MPRILILGGGAREIVIREQLSRDHTTFLLETRDFQDILSHCQNHNIQYVIPGSEWYLCQGVKNYLETHIPDIRVFGPDRYQAQIEGSKLFSKILMNKLKIPTAPFYYVKSPEHFWSDDCLDDIVVKYCGLASGKGVYLPCQTDSINDILKELEKFGNDGFVIENRYHGLEVSVMAFCNGTESFLMPQAQDYKNIYDGNTGPNTGGMGSICPVNLLSSAELNEIKGHIDSVVRELKYVGILYAGIIKTQDGVFFLEFNCRFGDPEAQSILNLLQSDLFSIIEACLTHQTPQIEWSNFHSATVVLSHNLYPESRLREPVRINWINDLDPGIKTYHSNVITDDDGNHHTTGGRVMSLTNTGVTREIALQAIYENIDKIQYDGVYYRRDIGSRTGDNNNLGLHI
tara:strand:- start:106 stop:1308 length:1203 start_codon:yes stop_codon:yes gene_type:complete